MERLLRAIDDLLSNGTGDRDSGEIGRCLARCQRCEHFRDDYCDRDGEDAADARRAFLERLIRKRLGCDRWSKGNPNE